MKKKSKVQLYKETFSGDKWESLTIEEKITKWLQICDGEFPTYKRLTGNLIATMKKSSDSFDNGHHKIAFNTPAVIYDRELSSYRPDYEYETIMFQNLLGKLRDKKLIELTADTEILGTGSAEDLQDYKHGLSNSGRWRPYITLTVSFESIDRDVLLKTIQESKDDICYTIVANIVNKFC